MTLRRQARRERERVVPESFEVRHARANTHRNVRIEHVRDGMSWINAYVPTTFASAFDDRSQALALAHQQAGDTRSRDQLITDTRSRDQLITDAFVAALMAGDDAGDCSAEPGSGTPATTGDQPAIPSLLESFRRIHPKITMTVPALVLLGHRTRHDGMPLDPAEIDGVGPIDPETARQLCGQATSFVRILTDPVTGGPIGIDERARIPSKRLKAWLRYRDGVCRHPGCSRPAIRCDLDHTCEYAHGGATCENNLAHLCRRHHRLEHLTNWRYTHGPAGTMQFTSPTGRRYDSPPERWVLKT